MTGLMWKGAAADKGDMRGLDERGMEPSGIAELRSEREEVARMSLSELLYYVLMGEGRATG